ncbi:MAG: hypothetical protein HY554_13310 [Elusimicrobia bacterium]|nr:hypothetical protein [Elusimicrobiota bacterium]
MKTDLADFASELRRPPGDPVLAAAGVMTQETRPGELAFVTYPDLSFVFHTPLAVVGGGQGRRPVRMDLLRWIVVRDEAEKSSFPVDWGLFEPVTLEAPSHPWGNRPDPGLHVFRTPRDAPAAVIYRRRS